MKKNETKGYLYLINKFNFVLIIFGVIIGSFAQAESQKGSDQLRVRIISASWCERCETMKNSLLNAKILSPSTDGVLYTGNMPIVVNGRKLSVPVDFIEKDLPGADAVRTRLGVESPKEQFVPYVQNYVGNKIVWEGDRGKLAREMNVAYTALDEAGSLSSTISAFQEEQLVSKGKKLPRSLYSSYVTPTRLANRENNQLASPDQVCADAKKSARGKNLALVVLKTHLCDNATLVCLKTASLISDPGNKFVHDNFAVYDSQFIQQGQMLNGTGETAIRANFNKWDSNPQYFVMNLKTCKVVFSEYGYNATDGMFASIAGNKLDFNKNYRALRHLLLKENSVASLIGSKYVDGNELQIAQELAYAEKIHLKRPQLTFHEIRTIMQSQNSKQGLAPGSAVDPSYPQNLLNGSSTGLK